MPLSASLKRRIRRLKGFRDAKVASVLAPSMTTDSRSRPFWARTLRTVSATAGLFFTTVTTESSMQGAISFEVLRAGVGSRPDLPEGLDVRPAQPAHTGHEAQPA